ncbi:MAG: hypothetical protein H7844_06210 [Nitrospirae bacterium YQR-1]
MEKSPEGLRRRKLEEKKYLNIGILIRRKDSSLRVKLWKTTQGAKQLN